MKRLCLFVVTGLLIFSTVLVAASKSELKPRLILDHANLIKNQEADGDELYFDISIFRVNQPTHYLRIPAKPFHWTSQRINDLSEITLWSGTVKQDQGVTLIVSLMETNMTPVYPDELIGSVRVKFDNKSGVLHTRWDMPNHSDGAVVTKGKKNHIQKFDLVNEGVHYKVYLSLD